MSYFVRLLTFRPGKSPRWTVPIPIDAPTLISVRSLLKGQPVYRGNVKASGRRSKSKSRSKSPSQSKRRCWKCGKVWNLKKDCKLKAVKQIKVANESKSTELMGRHRPTRTVMSIWPRWVHSRSTTRGWLNLVHLTTLLLTGTGSWSMRSMKAGMSLLEMTPLPELSVEVKFDWGCITEGVVHFQGCCISKV